VSYQLLIVAGAALSAGVIVGFLLGSWIGVKAGLHHAIKEVDDAMKRGGLRR